MPLARFSKRPNESYTRAIDMSGLLPSGRTMSTAAISATRVSDNSNAPTVVFSPNGTISGELILYRVQAGSLNEEYDYLFGITLDNGEFLEEIVRMRVESDPS